MFFLLVSHAFDNRILNLECILSEQACQHKMIFGGGAGCRIIVNLLWFHSIESAFGPSMNER
jgi:hypothetical protein